MKKILQSAGNIWMLTREYGGLAGAGGVKDVAEQLSRALAAWSGRKVSVVLPLYGFMDPVRHGFSPLEDPQEQGKELVFEVDMNYADHERREMLTVWYAKAARVHIYLLDSPRFREKNAVYTYTVADEAENPSWQRGEGHFDYFAMNLLLQKGTIQLLVLLREYPDIIHSHDGHTAVLPAIIAETPWLKSYFRRTGFLVTVHNAGVGYHQDVADLPYAKTMTGLPWSVILKSRLAGNFDPFIAAGHYAVINTVSENYARELQESIDDEQTGWLGHHLLDIGARLEGITNGVDPEAFDPGQGEKIGLAAAFDPRDDAQMAGKQQCRAGFVQDLAKPGSLMGVSQYGTLERNCTGPLFTFIGRLSAQKGVDILHDALVEIASRETNFQVVILGSGTAVLEHEIIALTKRSENAGRVCFLEGYNPGIANKVYSAGDFFLVPSRYEPCGLTDFIAQLFGNLPIVHHVGGLVKVKDGQTGFSYWENSAVSLVQAMERALQAYRDKQLIRKMQKEAVRLIDERYTWKEVKKQYLQLYKKALLEKNGR
jgi:starch synthase